MRCSAGPEGLTIIGHASTPSQFPYMFYTKGYGSRRLRISVRSTVFGACGSRCYEEEGHTGTLCKVVSSNPKKVNVIIRNVNHTTR